jgi:MinD-like ATPase involved in chromosome partitioning or flagellar assembly
MTIDQRDTPTHTGQPPVGTVTGGGSAGGGAFAGASIAAKYREATAPPQTSPPETRPPETIPPVAVALLAELPPIPSATLPSAALPFSTILEEIAVGPAPDLPDGNDDDDKDDDDLLWGIGRVSVATRPVVARRGLRGMLTRAGLRIPPGLVEQAELDRAAKQTTDEEAIRQATWTRAVSILIANPKGGVGKTPSAILIGGVLATVRGGSVCVVEVSDDAGSLTFRSEGNPTRGIGELVRDAHTISTAGQLAGYTAPQTSYASVIGTVTGTAGRRPRLSQDDVVAAASVIDQFYSLRIMDSGNQPSSPAFEGAVHTADALIIPLYNAGDAALEAVALLDSLTAAGGKSDELAANAVLLRLSDGRPENAHVVARVDRILERSGARVFDIPYDSHIAERGELTLSHLAESTRCAFTSAAAGIVRALQITVR